MNDFVVKQERNNGEGEPVVAGYTLGGKSVETDARECVAKSSLNKETGVSHYWIKVGTRGMEAGALFNPHSVGFQEMGSSKWWSDMGKGQYEFRKVSQECFDLYVQFLTHDRDVYIRHAERALRSNPA